MLKIQFLIVISIISTSLCYSEPAYVESIEKNLRIDDIIREHLPHSYSYNPYVDIAIWDKLKPYFLPFDHPVRSFLDEIFQNDRATLSRESMIQAGFELHAPKDPTNLVVGNHMFLEGYLVKAYLDTQLFDETDNFFRRITGAKSIKKCIQKHGYGKLFQVPKKWIYPLPLNPSPPNCPLYRRKNFVLIVEDMHLLNHHENGKCFKKKITTKILDALFTLLTEEGLIDSVTRGNIPFNIEGKMNFIDTEHHHLWPIPYQTLLKYLNPEMQKYWQSLIDNQPT